MAIPLWIELGIRRKRAEGTLTLEEEQAIRARFEGKQPAESPTAHTKLATWLGPPKPDEPLTILYTCTQRPGYGGASTESYEAIKLLRARGHHVTGFFVDGGDCNPDKLPDIRSCTWEHRTRPEMWAGSWHLIVGKMYEMGKLASAFSGIVPSVFINSGIRPERLNEGIVLAYKTGKLIHVDLDAVSAAQAIICHSTLDMTTFRNSLTTDLLGKLVPEVIRTSAMAAARVHGTPKPYAERKYDLCFTASDWGREEKNGGVMVMLTRVFAESGRGWNGAGKCKIVVCGGPRFGIPPSVDRLGLIPHPKMVEIMGDSRVVVIPSVYDSSPNIYIEAGMSGCNIVVSPYVGNCEGHPPELVAEAPTAAALQPCVERALKLDHQLHYDYETPDGAADRLAFWLRKIAEKGPAKS